MPIKSFKGLMADNTQERLNLHHNDGKVGYRIVKFQIMTPDADTNTESTIKIYKVEQTTVTDQIDFSDNHLLAAAIMGVTTDRTIYPGVVIFDNEIFNQDIFVTVKGESFTPNMNYYIELEQMPLALDEATVATLKDIRNSGDPT